ncbi:hypothetical protein EVAR_75484_1 [Eumeta japonica]|uniref:Uncharacterized protein n=1 Tax=Eumeta variegata TaxID=151549 RepID=A0A4C1TK18_EUMVA|nr:hypothetical protein EVAR_75484_1 [Eumeta japonica]
MRASRRFDASTAAFSFCLKSRPRVETHRRYVGDPFRRRSAAPVYGFSHRFLYTISPLPFCLIKGSSNYRQRYDALLIIKIAQITCPAAAASPAGARADNAAPTSELQFNNATCAAGPVRGEWA